MVGRNDLELSLVLRTQPKTIQARILKTFAKKMNIDYKHGLFYIYTSYGRRKFLPKV